MKYVQAKGLDLSAFALGTVQLGLTYGLGEHSEKPTEEAAFAILDRAGRLQIPLELLDAIGVKGNKVCLKHDGDHIIIEPAEKIQ